MSIPFGSLIAARPRVLPQTGQILGRLGQGFSAGWDAGQQRAAQDAAPDLLLNYLDTQAANYRPTLGNLAAPATGYVAGQGQAPTYNGTPTQANADLQTALTPGSETFDGRFALRRENASQQNPPPVAPYATNIAAYGSGLTTTGLDPAFGAGLDSAISAYIAQGGNPADVGIESLVRSHEQQQAAWDRYQRGEVSLAARPGTSRHEFGAAADIRPGPFLDWLHQNAGTYGLSFLSGREFQLDPVHVQLAGPSPAGTRAPAIPSGGGQSAGGYASQPAWAPPNQQERMYLRALMLNPATRDQGYQLAIQRMTPPAPLQPDPIEINGQLVDRNTGQVLGDYRDPQTAANRPTAEDQNGILRYRDTGEQVFPDVQTAPPTPDFGFVSVPGVGLVRTNDVAGTADTVLPAPPPGPDFQNEEALRDNFRTETGDYRLVQGHFQRLQAAAADPSAAGDIAMVFAFMKMLDPGSVVRETEYATAQNAAGVPTVLANLWNRIKDGERLAPEQRADFIAQASALFQATQQQFDQTTQRYTSIAEQYGMDPNRIFGASAAPAAGGAAPEGTVIQMPDGTQQIKQNGQWVPYGG